MIVCMIRKLIGIVVISIFFTSCHSSIELPFILSDNNRIVFEANINGKYGKYFWDTGAFTSQVNCNTNNLKVAYNGSLAQLSHSDNLTYFTLDKININGITINSQSEVSRITDSLQNIILTPEGFDGMLGINIFEGYWCEINFNKKKVILYKKKPVGFTESVKTTLENNYLLVIIDIDGIPTRFYIDTGAPDTMRFPESVKQNKPKMDIMNVATSESRDYSLVHIHEMIVFDKKINDRFVLTNTPFSQVSMSGGTGIIGINFLKNFNILIDLTNLKLLKTSDIFFTSINKDPEYIDLLEKVPDLGIISAQKISSGLLINYIIKEKLLFLQGVLPNSVITNINNIPIESYTQTQLYNFINSSNNDITLTVLTNNETKTIDLKKK